MLLQSCYVTMTGMVELEHSYLSLDNNQLEARSTFGDAM